MIIVAPYDTIFTKDKVMLNIFLKKYSCVAVYLLKDNNDTKIMAKLNGHVFIIDWGFNIAPLL